MGRQVPNPLNHYELHRGSDFGFKTVSQTLPRDQTYGCRSILDISAKAVNAAIEPGRSVLRSEVFAFDPVTIQMLKYAKAVHADPQQALNDIAVNIAQTQAILNLERHGEAIYHVSEALTHRLMLSDFKVRYCDVRLPAPCVFYQWDGTGVDIPNQDGTAYEFRAMYLQILNESNERADELSVPVYTKLSGVTSLRILVVSHIPNQLEGGNITFFDIPWPEDSEDLITTKDLCDRYRDWARESTQVSDKIPYAEIVNLMINTTLYLTLPSTRPELRPVPVPKKPSEKVLKNKKKGKKARDRYERELEDAAKRKRYWSIGDYISHIGGITKAASSSGDGGDGYKRLTWQHTVRGHMKLQAYGEGRRLRKTVWIEPYQRGPDAGDALRRRLTKVT